MPLISFFRAASLDRGAAALAALSNLTTLNLSNTRVNSEALIHFSDMKNLKSLAVYGCHGLGNAAPATVLESFQDGLPNLRCVRLHSECDNDGMVPATGESSDEEGDFDSKQSFESRNARTGIATNYDSDSEMEDAQDDDHQSDTSYSDHD